MPEPHVSDRLEASAFGDDVRGHDGGRRCPLDLAQSRLPRDHGSLTVQLGSVSAQLLNGWPFACRCCLSGCVDQPGSVAHE